MEKILKEMSAELTKKGNTYWKLMWADGKANNIFSVELKEKAAKMIGMSVNVTMQKSKDGKFWNLVDINPAGAGTAIPKKENNPVIAKMEVAPIGTVWPKAMPRNTPDEPDWAKINDEKRKYWEDQNGQKKKDIEYSVAINNAISLVSQHPLFSGEKNEDSLAGKITSWAERLLFIKRGLENFDAPAVGQTPDENGPESEKDIPF